MPKTEATINIQNVVSTGTLNQKVDLNAIVKNYPGAEYRPEQFPGVVLRLKRPKTATLIFSSSKIVCTEARAGKESRTTILQVVKELKKVGINLFLFFIGIISRNASRNQKVYTL